MSLEFVKGLIQTHWPTIATATGTILTDVGRAINVIPDTALTKTATIVGIISVIYLIQYHRKNTEKLEIERKILQHKYDQQVLGRREEDLK